MGGDGERQFLSLPRAAKLQNPPLIKYMWMREKTQKRHREEETIQNIKNYFQFLVNVLLCVEFMNA